jgi:hypothetical protein
MLKSHRFAWNLGAGFLLVCLTGTLTGCERPIYIPYPFPITKTLDPRTGIVIPEPGDCGASGCDAVAYSGSATGFVSTNGPSPVPASGNYTCSSISTKCEAADGTVTCATRPTKKCRSKFQYPTSGTVGYCSCDCLP